MLMWKILDDLWCPQNNPLGFISLGVAENSLMHEITSKHLHKHMNLPHHGLTYGDGSTGSKRLKRALSQFLNANFAPATNITAAHITITNGCSSALEHLSWATADSGDGFLLGRPFYGTFVPDLSFRTGATVVPVSFSHIDPLGADAVDRYEDAILAAHERGQRISGLVLCNPHNPLGRCYPREVIARLMRLCQKYKMHLISDEIYALSVWENRVDNDPASTPFCSASSIDLSGLIDPSLVHVIWGMSKDFGANGLRLGAIVSQNNPALHAALMPVALYSSVSSISDHVSANILEDNAWVQDYVHRNRMLLSERYELVTNWAKQYDITYAPGVNAAFFLWVDLGTAYKRRHMDEKIDCIDDKVMSVLLESKVFLAAGKQFGSEWPGWFRIVFAHDVDYLSDGLQRTVRALGLGH